METLISVGLESCLHYACCVALSTFAPHVSKKPLCYNYTSLPVCPQLRHFPFVHNYVTSFPVRQQLCHFLSGNNYVTSFPVRQQLYATSCPPRSYMSLSLPAHNYILPPTAISSRPQLYVAVSPTHHLLIKSAIPQQYTSQFPLATAAQKTAIVL